MGQGKIQPNILENIPQISCRDMGSYGESTWQPRTGLMHNGLSSPLLLGRGDHEHTLRVTPGRHPTSLYGRSRNERCADVP